MRPPRRLGREVVKKPVRALLVESERQGRLEFKEALSNLGEGHLDLEAAYTLASALERLSRGGLDLLFLDLYLPDSDGIATFERVHAFAPHVPVVVVAETYDEEVALATVQAGAQDVLVREVMSPEMVMRAARYAMERHRLVSALESLSLIDDLTGLYSLRGFSDLGERHLQLARRAGRPLLLIYLDLKSLRTINDALGHDAGDHALRDVAGLLRATFRQSDILARVGGDEFAVLAVEAGRDTQRELVERLRGKAGMMSHPSWEPYHLDLSVGTAWFDGTEAMGLQDLLAAAQERLSLGKPS